MTTYTLTGISVYNSYDPNTGDDVVAGIDTNTQFELVVDDSTTTLSYSLMPLEPGADARYGSIDVDASNARLNGADLGDDLPVEEETFFQVDWVDNLGIARSAIVLNLYLEDVNVSGIGIVDVDTLFHVSGDALPPINSVADFNAFEASVTGVSNPTGTFGPGTIALGSLGASVSENDLINGTPGPDSFEGGLGNDTISGFDGDDYLTGGVGNDILNGGNGYDRLYGGDGNDTIRTGDNSWSDDVYTGSGNDRVELTGITMGYAFLGHHDLNAAITVNLFAATNTLSIDKGVNGITTVIDSVNAMNADGLGIQGTDHDDTFNLNLNGGWISVEGGAGDDVINVNGTVGGLRIDYSWTSSGIVANLATRTISDDGDGGSDTINGTGNPTELRASMHDDDVTGSWRDESFILRAGNDTLDAGGGFDRLRYDRTGVTALDVDLAAGTATGTWYGETFNHEITGIEHVRGARDGNSIIAGSFHNERFEGQNGNDTLNGRGGDDTLLGNNGNDSLLGGDGNDTLDGGTGADTLRGENGNDYLDGRSGNDLLIGGDGNDILIGGDGNDTLRTGDNTIEDMVAAGTGNDRVELGGINNGFAWLDHTDLGSGITVTLNANFNSLGINKGAGGYTNVIGANSALRGAEGLGIGGTFYDDTFNLTLNGGWLMVRGEGGDDTFNINGTVGGLRLDYRSSAAGIVANLATRVIANDGFGGRDTINGTANPTELRATMHDDDVTGSWRNESFILMAGNDTLDAGFGFDRLRYDRTGVTSLDVDLSAGTASGIWRGMSFDHDILNVEYVVGSNEANDIMTGSVDNERFDGRLGNDRIMGGGGNDTLNGEGGNDSLLGEAGNDTLNGGAGNDTMRGGDGDDAVSGGIGDDVVAGNDGNDTLDGGDGNDSLYGGNGNDLLRANDGDDLIGAANGNDTVYGGAGNDTAYGGNGNDVIGGVSGNDRLFGNFGNDNMYGGTGNDSVGGGFGNDRVFGGHGDDVLYGGAGNDSIGGATGDDLIWANDGDDVLYGGTGNDTMRGGDGHDRFFAGADDDLVFGQAGNDTLNGFDGNDTLDGGAGNDQMNGGRGVDTFVFSGGADVITDFTFYGAEADVIDLSGVASITDFTDLIDNHVSFTGGGIVIDDGAGNTLRLEGTTPISALTEAHFDFGG